MDRGKDKGKEKGKDKGKGKGWFVLCCLVLCFPCVLIFRPALSYLIFSSHSSLLLSRGALEDKTEAGPGKLNNGKDMEKQGNKEKTRQAKPGS